jgi:hypothetical protein
MASTKPHTNRAYTSILLKLPEEIRMMIYELCMSTDTPTSSPKTPSAMSKLRDAQIPGKWDGYIDDAVVKFCGDDTEYHDIDCHSFYYRGGEFRIDGDGRGKIYSFVMVDEDPKELPPQVEEWMSGRGWEGVCGCL